MFGAGFSISCVGIYTVWMIFVIPAVFNSQMVSSETFTESSPASEQYPYIENFHELPVNEKIEKSTAILVTEIHQDGDGKYKNTVVEVLKQDEGVELYYKVGDTYEDYDQYGENDDFIPKGLIVFMGGNPAGMRFSVSYTGERIDGLGGIPLALMREKCEP